MTQLPNQREASVWQFSLKTLLILMLVSAGYFAGWSTGIRRAREAEERAKMEAARARDLARLAEVEAMRAEVEAIKAQEALAQAELEVAIARQAAAKKQD